MEYIGYLKPKKWFLENGWNEQNDYIEDTINSFRIYNDELKAELELKETTFNQLGLELEDENGTLYKKEWFKYLKEID